MMDVMCDVCCIALHAVRSILTALVFVITGHHWKHGQWTKDEVDRLQSNIMAYCQVSVIYFYFLSPPAKWRGTNFGRVCLCVYNMIILRIP